MGLGLMLAGFAVSQVMEGGGELVSPVSKTAFDEPGPRSGQPVRIPTGLLDIGVCKPVAERAADCGVVAARVEALDRGAIRLPFSRTPFRGSSSPLGG